MLYSLFHCLSIQNRKLISKLSLAIFELSLNRVHNSFPPDFLNDFSNKENQKKTGRQETEESTEYILFVQHLAATYMKLML